MRILYLNACAAIGGAERVLLDTAASLRAAEPAVELDLVLPSDGPLRSAAEAQGLHVHILPMPAALVRLGDSALRRYSRWRTALTLACWAPSSAWAVWRYAAQLRRLIQAISPQIVHSNSLKFHLLTRLARLPRQRVAWHLHDFISSRPLMARALRWASARCMGAIAVSEAVARDAQLILPRLPLTVVPNAVDTDRFRPGPAQGSYLDELAGLAPAGADVVRIGLVATFARWKGHEVFLEAATRLLREQPSPEVRFYIVGGPIYQTHNSQWSLEELRGRARELLTSGRVGFIPFQHDTPAIYRALDVVVHASTQPEPFGLTIVEAMACARPVVVTLAGGAGELITPEVDALGVPPGDAAALAAALQRLVRDPSRRHDLGRHARQTAAGKFHRDRLGAQILAAYAAFQSGALEQRSGIADRDKAVPPIAH